MKNFPLELAVGALMGEVLPGTVRQMSKLGVSHYEINSAKLPKEFEGFKIVQLSDLHNKRYGKYDIGLYKRIDREDPDIIVMTGDMISHKAPNREDFFAFVKLLCRKYPVYYVNGNHELSDMDKYAFEAYSRRLASAGAVCLDNKCEFIKRGESKLRLCGLCYTAEYYRGVREYKSNWEKFTLEDMKLLCGELPKDGLFTVLLAHNPLDFDVHEKWGADVSFGGHIHGGFIRLPIVGGIISPELKLFPKYKEGIYKKNQSSLVVSRGLGRIRFFNPPDLVSAVLKSLKY